MRLALIAHLRCFGRSTWFVPRYIACLLAFLGVLFVLWLAAVVICTAARAEVTVFAQTPSTAKPPSPEQPFPPALVTDAAEIPRLLAHTLPQWHLDPTALPPSMHQHVVERIREYGIVYRGDVQEMLDRAAPYWPLIRLALQTHGVPEYFGYLPFVESAFQVDARHSRSGAAGLWQLMRSTARTYGLRVTKEIDERFEPTRATTAAVRYLRDLQAMFGPRHPLLTVAAYNYGEYNLSKAIARTRTRDIWRLVRLHQLPDQTREYLIRTIAVWVVVAHAERFGLRMDFPEQPLSYLELTFDKPIVLAELAQQLQVSSQHLRAMNPHLLVEQVPSLVPIHVPAHVLQMPKQVEVRLAPQALQKKTCCARLHLLTPAEAVELALPAAGIASKPVSFPRPPTPETPVLATVPQ